MIADAIDTAITLGWALAAWIVLTAAVGCAAVYAVVVAVWWPCRVAGDAVAGALAASRALRALGCGDGPHEAADGHTAARGTTEGPSDGRGSRHSAPQTPGEGFPAPGRPGRSQTRSRPSWAQPEQDAA